MGIGEVAHLGFSPAGMLEFSNFVLLYPLVNFARSRIAPKPLTMILL